MFGQATDRVAFLGLWVLTLACGHTPAVGATQGTDTVSAAPATVDHRVPESDLTVVRLTPQAAARLGIETAPLVMESVSHTTQWPGELMIPPGRSLSVSAPIAGILVPVEGAALPLPGDMVTLDRPLAALRIGGDGNGLSLSDRLALEKTRADLSAARVEADGRLSASRIRASSAQVRLERTRRMTREDIGSQRALDDAESEYDLSLADVRTAEQQVAVLDRVLGQLDSGQTGDLSIMAPFAGVVRNVHSSAGQAVPAGALLFAIEGLDTLWIRVPVHTSERTSLDAVEEARVAGSARNQEDGFRSAKRIRPPGTADPASATVDMYFEIANEEGTLSPGQRVTVRLAGPPAMRLVIPAGAILFDSYGGAWAYEASSETTFVRRRVDVQEFTNGVAVLRRGPAAGTAIVTQGAAELFGVEFGAGK